MQHPKEMILQILQSGGKAGENLAKAGELPSFTPDEIRGLPLDVKIDLAQNGLFPGILLFDRDFFSDKDSEVACAALKHIDFTTFEIKEEDLDRLPWKTREGLAAKGALPDVFIFSEDSTISLAAFNHPDFNCSSIKEKDLSVLSWSVRAALAKKGFFLEVLVFDAAEEPSLTAFSHPDFNLSSIKEDDVPNLHWVVREALAKKGLFLESIVLTPTSCPVYVRRIPSAPLIAFNHADFNCSSIKVEDAPNLDWQVCKELTKKGLFLDTTVFHTIPEISLAAFNHPDFDASLIRSEDVDKLCKEVRERLAKQGFLLGTLAVDKDEEVARIAVSHPDFDIAYADLNVLTAYAELAPSFLEKRGILKSASLFKNAMAFGKQGQ